MQQVATEIRLLTVLQRQDDAHSRLTHEPPAAPSHPTPIEPTDLSHASAATEPEAPPPIVPLGPESFGAPKPKPPAKEAPAGGSCPKCACSVVYVSRPRSRVELFFERMNFPIVRCHRCYHRYVVIGSFKFSKEIPVGTARKFRPSKRHD